MNNFFLHYMNIKSAFRSFLLLNILFLALISCDKDFNTIGADVVQDEHFGFNQYTGASIVAYNKFHKEVQTNNLPINALGVVENSVFGKTRANFVTQLELTTTNLTYDKKLQTIQNGQIVLDSVVLTIPYFSTRTAVAADGKGTYVLDSIQGNAPIDLKVFENGFFLNDLNPSSNFQDAQNFYSNQDDAINNTFNDNKVGNPLNDAPLASENVAFLPNAKEYVIKGRTNLLAFEPATSTTAVQARVSPRISLHLNKTFFQNKITNLIGESTATTSSKLASNVEFKKHFRGLYFQVANAPNGSLMKLNFAAGDITLHWHEYTGVDATTGLPVKFDHDTNPATAELNKETLKTLTLNLRGNAVNLIEHTDSPQYNMARLATANTTTGDQNLWIKGGANGSVAYIDLFGKKDEFQADGITAGKNDIPDELDLIRREKWLINEANLTFFVDKTIMNQNETSSTDLWKRENPYRIYLYDATNNVPIVDYILDAGTTAQPKFSKFVFGGLALNKADGTRNDRYKIRITNYMRALVNGPSPKNVKLGLSVTEFIGVASSSLLTTGSGNPFAFDKIPTASVLSQKGTVLYGTNPNVTDANRLKLEIYYSKPN